MLTINARDFLAIAPEVVLTAWGLALLLVDLVALRGQGPARRQRVLGGLALLGALAAVAAPSIVARATPESPESAPVATAAAPSTAPTPATAPSPLPISTDSTIFFGTLSSGVVADWANLLIVALLAMVVGMSMTAPFTEHWGEYYALLLWAAVGMMLLAASEELLTLFLTLETMTLCLYLATAFETGRRRSAEGGLKYFVYGSVSSALFLFGLSLIYGLTGSTSLSAIHLVLTQASDTVSPGLAGNVAGATAVLLVLVGFGFKVAAVPFHQWAPDAYEGAPAPVSAWVASGSKVASFIALMKVLVFALGPWASAPDRLLTSPGWIALVALIAAATMTYGNFAALAQRNLKRMLAYSSIAHAGYILVGVLAASVQPRNAQAAGAVLFYLVVYSFTTVGAFAVAAWLVRDTDRDDIDDLNGLGARSPALAVCIVLLMLSLIGMPPLAGFFGKLYMFMEALKTPGSNRPVLIGLVALGLANSVVSAFYYVRVLKAMFLRPSGPRPLQAAPGGVRWPIAAATVVAVVFGLYPAPLLDSCKVAATYMLKAGSSTGGKFSTQRDPTFKAPTAEEIEAKNREMRKYLGTAGAGLPPSGPGTPKAESDPASRTPPEPKAKGQPKGKGRPKAKGAETPKS